MAAIISKLTAARRALTTASRGPLAEVWPIMPKSSHFWVLFLSVLTLVEFRLRFRRFFCHIVRFCTPMGLEFIEKNVKNINFTFLQICKKKTGKYFLFTFLAITSIIIKLEKHTIWQIKPLNLIYIIYFMLYSDKMTKNMQKTVIFEGKLLLEELRSSKKRLIKMLLLRCLKNWNRRSIMQMKMV